MFFGPKKGTLDWHWKHSRGEKLTNPNFSMCKASSQIHGNFWYLCLNYKFDKPIKTLVNIDINDFQTFIGFTDDEYSENFSEIETMVRYEGFLFSYTFGSGHVVSIPENFVKDTGWVVL